MLLSQCIDKIKTRKHLHQNTDVSLYFYSCLELIINFTDGDAFNNYCAKKYARLHPHAKKEK